MVYPFQIFYHHILYKKKKSIYFKIRSLFMTTVQSLVSSDCGMIRILIIMQRVKKLMLNMQQKLFCLKIDISKIRFYVSHLCNIFQRHVHIMIYIDNESYFKFIRYLSPLYSSFRLETCILILLN